MLTEKQLKECTDGHGHSAEKLTPYYANDYPDVTYPDGYVSKYRYGVCLMPTTFDLSITPDDLFNLYTVVKEKLNESYYKRKDNIKWFFFIGVVVMVVVAFIICGGDERWKNIIVSNVLKK